jgi:hypothetical protein
MQLEGIIATSMNEVINEIAWLIMQKRIWAVDHGQIAKIIYFTIKIKNLQLTFSSSVGSPLRI